MNDWFTINTIDEHTYIISEYRHWEETHCYLLIGDTRALLIDTGLGIGNMYEEVIKLTDKPIAAIATHIHWDHIGGHKYFPDFYAHANEIEWLHGKFPLSLATVKELVMERCALPPDFDIHQYELFQGTPVKLLHDHDVIDIGNRQIEVLHTPGHSPGHVCFWEKANGYLYSGDLIYKGTLLAYFPSTDPNAYLTSLRSISKLPVKRIFPAHHTLDIQPEIIPRMYQALLQLQRENKLHHGSGTFDFGDWSIRL